jgi:HEAT repeat protein
MRLVPFLALLVQLGCAQRAADPISAAFADVRRGKLETAARLSVTASDVPAIAAYLKDENEDVVREAVVILARIGGPSACDALVAPLASRSADVRERAARGIYSACPPEATAAIPGLAAALRQSIQTGTASAAPVLLLGRFQDEETRAFLRNLLASNAPVKREPWNTPVPLRLAAAVAGVSAGVEGAQNQMAQGLGSTPEAEFLAGSIGDVRDTRALGVLLPLLDSDQTVRSSVPSGAQPQRRVRDVAVDGFAARLRLSPSFALRPSDRYTDAEISEIRRLTSAAVKQP